MWISPRCNSLLPHVKDVLLGELVDGCKLSPVYMGGKRICRGGEYECNVGRGAVDWMQKAENIGISEEYSMYGLKGLFPCLMTMKMFSCFCSLLLDQCQDSRSKYVGLCSCSSNKLFEPVVRFGVLQ